MLPSIDPNIPRQSVELYLAKPNRTVVGKLKEAYQAKQNFKFGQINELSFSVPYVIERSHELVDNPHIKLIHDRYLIKAVRGSNVEWYVVIKPNKVSNDSVDDLKISCFSQGYELSFKRLKNYQKDSINCLQALEDCLQGTGWTVGTVSDDLKLMYRSFNFSGNRLEFLYQICTTFSNSYPIFDTINKTVSIYVPTEIGQNRGMRVGYGKLLREIEYTTDLDKVCTRLYCYGKDDMSLQKVNPNGQEFIDDFSYFLYPFQRDENKNVIQSSYYMSDSLANALLDYEALLKAHQSDFNTLLLQLENHQALLSTKQIELNTLQSDLTIILDNIENAKNTNQDTSQYISQRDAKQVDITTKQGEIGQVSGLITTDQTNINTLISTLSYENNFTSDQLTELQDYTFEQEYTDSNITVDTDLYNVGVTYFQDINTPPIDVKLSIINLHQVLEEQKNWDKLVIGDYITVKYDKLNIDIKTRITEIDIDYETDDVQVQINNGKELVDKERQFIKNLYKTVFLTNDIVTRKYAWENSAYNFNNRNDRISITPADPIVANDGNAIDHVVNDDGSVDISFEWTFNGAGDAYNIDGFVVYIYSSTTSDKYVFGSTIAKEITQVLTPERRNIILSGVSATRWYTFGVQAFRDVDNDIAPNGILKSNVVQPTNTEENPYQPSSEIAFNGTINGTVTGVVNGISAGNMTQQQSGSYTGNGSGQSITIQTNFVPKQVIIYGGYQQDGVNYNAQFNLTTNTCFIYNTNNQSSNSTDLRCTSGGFTISNTNNLGNVNGQTYDWIAIG